MARARLRRRRSLITTGSCIYNKRHKTDITTLKSNKFISNKSCDKCCTSFHETYFDDKLLIPHYYHCRICQKYACFNCVFSVYGEEWRKQTAPTHIIAPDNKPKLINRLRTNQLFENKSNDILNKYIKKIIKLIDQKIFYMLLLKMQQYFN